MLEKSDRVVLGICGSMVAVGLMVSGFAAGAVVGVVTEDSELKQVCHMEAETRAQDKFCDRVVWEVEHS